MVNMIAVGHKHLLQTINHASPRSWSISLARTVAEHSTDHRQERVDNGHAKAQKGNDDRGRRGILLRPGDDHDGEDIPQHQAAGIAEKNFCRIEIKWKKA